MDGVCVLGGSRKRKRSGFYPGVVAVIGKQQANKARTAKPRCPRARCCQKDTNSSLKTTVMICRSWSCQDRIELIVRHVSWHNCKYFSRRLGKNEICFRSPIDERTNLLNREIAQTNQQNQPTTML